MARIGKAFFDNRGGFHKTPEEAVMADIAALLGKIGEGESLSLGIAHVMMEKREQIEALFEQYDRMVEDMRSDNVTQISASKSGSSGS